MRCRLGEKRVTAYNFHRFHVAIGGDYCFHPHCPSYMYVAGYSGILRAYLADHFTHSVSVLRKAESNSHGDSTGKKQHHL